MNRDELEKILEEQRARRTARAAQYSPAPREKRFVSSFERLWWTILIFIVALFGIFALMMISFSKSLDARMAEASSLSAIPKEHGTLGAQVASPAVMTTDPASVSAKVCTNVPDGRLHVRFTAGEGGEVRGYLAEGETVQIALVNGQMETQTVNGEDWLKLLSPVEGWSNKIYICEIQK